MAEPLVLSIPAGAAALRDELTADLAPYAAASATPSPATASQPFPRNALQRVWP